MERLTYACLSNWNYGLCANVMPKRRDTEPKFQKAINSLGRYEDLNRTPADLASDLAELAAYRAKGKVEDLEKVKTGEWERMINSYGELEGFMCTCGTHSLSATNFCSYCGSKMTGGERRDAE